MSDSKPVEMKPSANQPVEAEDALPTNVTPAIFTFFSTVALVFFIIGTPLPWVRSDLGGQTLLSLWEYTQTTTGGTVFMKVGEHPCDEFKKYFRTAEAFAIITLVVSALTVLMGVASRIRETSTKPLGTIFAFLTFTASLVTWSIVVSAYNKSFCGQPTLIESRFYIYSGAGLFLGGWLATIIGLLVSLKDIIVPKVTPKAALNKLVAVVFTVAAGVAFVFALVSTIVSLFSKWSTLAVQTRASIWYVYSYNNDEFVQKTKLTDVHCGDFGNIARLGQAFHVTTIVACLFAFIAGVVAVRGVAGIKAIILSGLFATACAVITVGADAALFYKVFCTNSASFDYQQFHHDGGVALIVTTLVLMAASTIFAVVIAFTH